MYIKNQKNLTFIDLIRLNDTILMNGPLGTRLKYFYNFDIEKKIAIFDLLEKKEGQDALSQIYCGDIEVAQEYHLPIVINAATFRASKNHLASTGTGKQYNVKDINMKCIDFVKSIKDSKDLLSAPIYISAPFGSMYDAYSVNTALTVEIAKNYHSEQLNIFREAEIDFVHVVTISSLIEAMGISYAAQDYGLEYTIGFVLNENGLLLDGATLHEAINKLDSLIQHKPLGYFVTCTHPSILIKLVNFYPEYGRLIGMQINGSSLPSSLLAIATKSLSDSPEQLAKSIWDIKKRLKIKIIGGCCGTSVDHLREIAKLHKLHCNC